ncbi:MAG: hypothetical protein NZ602_15840 [Thermoguttaceae bacterium]|nr:hypothetical protein [Thermoguttaceae bacterium]MDW8039669.1 hypothetical protein [Thermoguttaceae bacterium]
MAGWQCHVVGFEGRASFPLWARQGQPTAPRRRRNAQGQLILERGICSYSQVLNFWYDAVREAIQTAGAIAWDQIPPPEELPKAQESTPTIPQWVVYWYYYAQNHWRRALRDILRLAGVGSPQPPVEPTGSSSSSYPTISSRETLGSETPSGLNPPPSPLERGKHTESPAAPSSRIDGPKELGQPSRFCLVLLGFSNGGDAVYQTAKALQRRGIRVDLVITVDPVRKPLRGMGFMGFRRPANVARWINYYQRFDRRTLAGILPIVGRHVDGADENIRLGPEDFPDPKTRPKAHVWIPSLELIRRRIRDEIVALLQRAELG